MGENATILIDHKNAWKYPEGKYNKKISDVDGVSGATVSWEEGKGNKLIMIIRILQYKLWKIFVHVNNTIPLSNVQYRCCCIP